MSKLMFFCIKGLEKNALHCMHKYYALYEYYVCYVKKINTLILLKKSHIQSQWDICPLTDFKNTFR